MNERDIEPNSQIGQRPSALRTFLVQVPGRGASLVISLGFYLLNRHYRLIGDSTAALWSLGGAVVFGYLALHGLFGRLRAVALSGAALLGLLGYWKGGPTVGAAVQSPFAVMGAMQAVMHQNQPRNAQQAAALREFAQSLSGVEQFAGGDMTSPDNAMRAMRVINNILGKAERLGATELAADPKYQNALSRFTTRTGLNVGLDSVDEALQPYLKNPAVAKQAAALRSRLDQLRSSLAQ